MLYSIKMGIFKGVAMTEENERPEQSSIDAVGKGLALPGLIIGLITGFAVYGIVEFWIKDIDDNPLALTVLFFTVTTAISYLLLAERDRFAKAAIGAIAIAGLMIVPDYFISSTAGSNGTSLEYFPAVFWFFISRALIVYLLVTMVKSSLENGGFPPYERVFFHGLTMPLIAIGAKIFAGLALLLLIAWAQLLKEMDVIFFHKLFQEPWFIFPFLGAIGGLSIGLMRGQQAVLGALRFILLLFSRIVMPITALFTITLMFVLVAKGTGIIFDRPYPSAWMIGLALTGMLIFNGVYQNGEGGPPPTWLRLSTIITLTGFPIYAGLAFYAILLRTGAYGLTPPRIGGLAITGLVAAYSVVCVAGLITELNWRGKRWMPLVGSLNTLMAVAWVVVLTVIATPIANPWAISATSQYNRIANETVSAAEFDFGYLQFKLGKPGQAALDRMLALDHPEKAEIQAGVDRARAADNYWQYKTPMDKTEAAPLIVGETTDGPMALELNPAEEPEIAQPELDEAEAEPAPDNN